MGIKEAKEYLAQAEKYNPSTEDCKGLVMFSIAESLIVIADQFSRLGK